MHGPSRPDRPPLDVIIVDVDGTLLGPDGRVADHAESRAVLDRLPQASALIAAEGSLRHARDEDEATNSSTHLMEVFAAWAAPEATP